MNNEQVGKGAPRLKRSVLLGALVLTVGAVVITAEAKPGYLARAQELGFDAKDCTYCHTKPTGGSGWNARGTWLKAQKKKRHASDVDVAWLKDYKGK